MQVALCLLIPLGIAANTASKLQCGYYSEFTEQRQLGSNDGLSSDNSVFGNDCFELRRGGSLSLLCSGSSAEISALARSMYKGLHRAPAQETIELPL